MKIARLFALTIGLLAAVPLAAQSEPAAKLQRTVDTTLDAIYGECCADAPVEDKEARVRAIVEENFSLLALVRRAIGRNWQKMSPDGRGQVVELITRLVVKAFVRNLDGTERPEIAFGETIEITDKRIEVPSTVTAEGKTYRIVYRLGRLKTGWEIYDIVAEDISIVANYRQQFDEHFRTKDGAALIARLEELLKTEDIGNEVKI